MRLFPIEVKNYDKYWESMRKYNSWFIQLRYMAVVALLLLFIFLARVLQFEFSKIQYIFLGSTAIGIFLYNVYFRHYCDKIKEGIAKLNSIQVSLAQICLDLFSLAIIVYFTGGIETPLLFFFLFHMIIGSIILPKKLMYRIAGVIVLVILGSSLLEYFELIKHQRIGGLFQTVYYNDLSYLITINLIFGSMMPITVYLTNKIARELQKREVALKEAYDLLEEAEKSKQKFIIAVVHELKSPIASATSQLNLISNGFVTEKEEINQKVNRATIRLDESINRINDILKISKFKLLKSKDEKLINISELIKTNVEDYIEKAKNKNIELNYSNSTTNQQITGDEVLLNLVFSNLIGNAVKYTVSDGKVQVTHKIEKENHEIRISDSGIGIPEGEFEKIFKEYYRASNTKNKAIEGTGTGLSVVKQIIEQHKGTIKVKSPSEIGTQEKPGTEFYITLPINEINTDLQDHLKK
ncbi:MAG: sensor histidine kinase [Rhodothermaceae bacterium]